MEGSSTTASMTEELQWYDTIVVGAGIIGSCAAYELSRRGQRVLLLEQFDFLHHRGSSHGESRIIRTTYPEPYYTSMVLDSFRLWESAQAQSGYRVLTPTPHLDVGPQDCRALQLCISSCLANSVPVQILSPNEVQKLFGGVFQIPDRWIAVKTEFGGIIKPTKAVSMFQALASKNGAVLLDRTQVTSISKLQAHDVSDGAGGVEVNTASGVRLRGNKCIVAAGAWVGKLVNEVTSGAVHLPVQPIHATVCYWKVNGDSQESFTADGGCPTFASYGEPFIYGTPSLEFPGLVKVALHGGYECNPDMRNWEADVALMTRSIGPWIEKVFGGSVAAEKPVITQACMYSITPDEDFIIDCLGGEFGEDVVVAAGFSGHGFKMGPAVGKILADMVLGSSQLLDLTPFRIGRFLSNPRGNPKEYTNQVSSSGSHPLSSAAAEPGILDEQDSGQF